MEPTKMKVLDQPLRGIVVPLVTPLKSANELDEGGLERLIEHVLAGGVSALFVLGTTGEGTSLSGSLRRRVIERTAEQLAGRAPLLTGITDTAFSETLDLACFAANHGAHGVVYAGPAYSPVSQPELIANVARVAESSPLPLFLYNMPSHTHTFFELETVIRLAELPGVVGLKDSSGNLIYFERASIEMEKRRPDFSLLMGPEEILAAALLGGAHGGVNGGANLFPELYVQLYEACRAGDWAAAARLNRSVLQISAGIYASNSYASSYLRGLKCALSLAGICSEAMAEPYGPLEAAERERIAEFLAVAELK
ncbi:MAG: dihydrodipicolinate synthase family protein [Bryobacteraceae bacterium]|nr:dihydrodipicolinate synthase family protein [Bryobacteraceae bacterium]